MEISVAGDIVGDVSDALAEAGFDIDRPFVVYDLGWASMPSAAIRLE